MSIRRTDIDRVVAIAREIRLWANQVGVPIYGIKKFSDTFNGDKKVVTTKEKVNRFQKKEKVNKSRIIEIKDLLKEVDEALNKNSQAQIVEIRKGALNDSEKEFVKRQFDETRANLDELQRKANEL